MIGEESMAVKVLFTYDYGKENMNSIKELGYDVSIIDEKKAAFSESIKDTEVLVCYNPFNSLDISLLKDLRYIQLSSIGIDQLPIDIVKQSNIQVCNNKGGYSIPIGEWIVMSILQLMKNSHGLYRNQLNKLWKMKTNILEVYGKTIGFIGTGSIAVEAAKRLKGFGVGLIGINTNGRNIDYFDECHSIDQLDQILSICDVVVITVPSTKETKHLIDKAAFSKLKRGAFLVNVARGSILDESALIESLKTGNLAGAALDVFEEEPLGKDSELWTLSNAIITPHNSWISEMRNERRWKLIYENLRRYINGEDLVNKVDLEKGY